MDSNNLKIKSGFAWTTFDKVSSQIVQFLVSVVIARLISPSDYGILGIINTFIIISQVFIESGLGSALIYKSDKNPQDLYSAFSFNLIISLTLFGFIFFSAPFIENYFAILNLSDCIRVSSFVLLSNALVVVPTAILRINFAYKSLAISNVISTIVSGFVGIILAYEGYGYWTLIVQMLSRSILQYILITFYCRWIPRLRLYKKSFVELYHYGFGLFGASFITKIVDESTVFFVGKLLTPYSLGLYTRANQFAGLPSTSLVTIVSSVIFPSLSSIKNDEEKFNLLFKKSVSFIAAICIPLFLWIFALSEPIVKIILTDKWIAVVPIMQILCIGRCFYPIANISEQVINAKGRSDLFLNQQLIKMLIKAFFVIILIRYGLLAVAIADTIYTSTQYFVTCFFLRKVNSFTFIEQLKTIWKYIIASFISSLVVLYLVNIIQNAFVSLSIGIVVAMTIYGFLLYILKADITPANIVKTLKEKNI